LLRMPVRRCLEVASRTSRFGDCRACISDGRRCRLRLA
jgi:hypothetical protein